MTTPPVEDEPMTNGIDESVATLDISDGEDETSDQQTTDDGERENEVVHLFSNEGKFHLSSNLTYSNIGATSDFDTIATTDIGHHGNLHMHTHDNYDYIIIM